MTNRVTDRAGVVSVIKGGVSGESGESRPGRRRKLLQFTSIPLTSPTIARTVVSIPGSSSAS